MPTLIFFWKGWGFESISVTDTRAKTDRNDPFLNRSKHEKRWMDKKWAKCNMAFHKKIPARRGRGGGSQTGEEEGGGSQT